jgi:hypothetical protein
MSHLSNLIDGGVPAAVPAATRDATIDDEIVGVISAAIHRYERSHGLRRSYS